MSIVHFASINTSAKLLQPNIEARTYSAVVAVIASLAIKFANTGLMTKTPVAGGQPSADEWLTEQPVPTSLLANWSIRVRSISGAPTTGPVNTWINFAVTPEPVWNLVRVVAGTTAWDFQVDISRQQNGADAFYTSPTVEARATVP